MSPTQLVIVTTTFATETDANDMAQRLVERRLVACAQVEGPLTSHYVWDGKACCEREWRLTLKTARAQLPGLYHYVHQHHAYDCPQWLVVAVDAAGEAYERWALAQMQVDDT